MPYKFNPFTGKLDIAGSGGGGQEPFGAVVDAAGGGDYTTLGAAIDDGATNIFVKNGSYTETDTITTSTSQLTVVGESRDNTVITWTGGSIGISITGGWRQSFSNLTFVGSGSTTTDAIIKSTRQHLEIDNCYLKTTASGGNGIEATAFYANIKNCHFESIAASCFEGASSMARIENNLFIGGHVANRHAIKNPGMNSVITGNTFYDWDNATNNEVIVVDAAFKIGRTAITGNHFSEHKMAIHITHADSDRVVVTGNTFNPATTSSTSIYIDVAVEEWTITGNSFDGGDKSIYFSAPDRCTISSNTMYGRGTTAGGIGIHLDAGCDNNIISNNQVHNYQTGLEITDSTCDDNQVISNDLTLNGTDFTDGGTGTITLIDKAGITIDGGGGTITTGIKGDIEIPYDCTITQVTLLADQSGSIVIDIWKDTYANYPPTDADSITSSAPPTITTATKSQDGTLTGWTTSVTAGDILRFNVDSCTTITKCTLILKVTKP